ncbi:MAG TPA: hypothetical protein VMT46_11060 [Anaerolineaceae bacterium]|nr:hypothetical protein [Anaerolineaceae bacterium]
MTLQEIIETLQLTPLTEPRDYATITPTGGYASDLLSCVMAGAKRSGVWVTLQAHANIVAVAALLDLAAVIVTEDAQPDPVTIEKANLEGVILLGTKMPTYTVVGKLWASGLKTE